MLTRFKVYIVLLILSAVLDINGSQVNNIVIIGGGPSGLAAAIYAGRAELNPLVIEGEPGQLTKASLIENMPGVAPILGSDLADNMHNQAEQLGARFIKGPIVRVDFSSKPFTLWTKDNEIILANSVIIATGAKKTKLNCPGEDEYENKGVALCATCDGPLFKDKNITLIGGDYSALREALILSKFTNNLTIINKREKLKGPSSLLKPVLKNSNIKVINNSIALEILGNEKEATGVRIINTKTDQESIIPSDAIFIATNWVPATDIFKNKIELDSRNSIKVHNHTETSIPGIFAVGDATNNSDHQVPTACGSGYEAAMKAEKYLIRNNLF
ncbi:MAG: FAD-dependent oxidoreductase [Candidatus Babeliales bacterium]|nr:FAD-dependent oxidoreductase [Candidatus Babeliales bacterium]